MGRELTAMLDRRLAASVVARLRRRWPLLALVPAPWILPLVTPGARRLRRALARGMIVVVAAATAVVMVMVMAIALIV